MKISMFFMAVSLIADGDAAGEALTHMEPDRCVEAGDGASAAILSRVVAVV